jgi:ABC-type xylose transport system permease subunit
VFVLWISDKLLHAAAVLGGVSLRGGIGRVELVALVAIFLLTLTNAMDLMRIDTRLQSIVLGCILAVAVSVEVFGLRQQMVRVGDHRQPYLASPAP